jgi:hypothetical protein
MRFSINTVLFVSPFTSTNTNLFKNFKSHPPGNRALNRFHITDNVPFQSNFDGCIETWKYTNDSFTRYGMTPYWYLSPGGTDSYRPQSLNARTNYYVPDNGRQIKAVD